MTEYYTQAVVLDKLPHKEQDMRVMLYTQELGKVAAKVQSARKITSKLNGHLEPGNVVAVRIVEKGGLQVVDALTLRRLPANNLLVLRLVHDLTGEWEPDPMLWAAAINEQTTEPQMLQLLGFDVSHATCGICERRDTLKFSAIALNYFCLSCYNLK